MKNNKRLPAPTANEVVDVSPKKKSTVQRWLELMLLLLMAWALLNMFSGVEVLSNISNTPNTDPSASATRIAELLAYAKQMAKEAKAESLKAVAVQQAPETKADSPPILVDPAKASASCENPLLLPEVVDLKQEFGTGSISAEQATNRAIDICANVCFADGNRNPFHSMDCDEAIRKDLGILEGASPITTLDISGTDCQDRAQYEALEPARKAVCDIALWWAGQ